MKKILSLFTMILVVNFMFAQQVSSDVAEKAQTMLAKIDAAAGLSKEQSTHVHKALVNGYTEMEQIKTKYAKDRDQASEMKVALGKAKDAMQKKVLSLLKPDQAEKVKAAMSKK